MGKVFIIAEAGVNHNGSILTAKRLIDVASEAGADAVKFQSFKAEKVISRYAPKAEYQKTSTGTAETQLEMARRLELTLDDHKTLIRHCQNRRISFLSTAFDEDSLSMLCDLNVPILKVPSGEITNLPYLRKIGEMRKRIILSSGMATLDEIKVAVGILTKSGTPKNKITVLHCNTEYPTPFCDVNLRAMVTIGKKLGVKIGYSDHTLGIEVPIAATALGAVVIEKHFTLNRSMRGPDHRASLEPNELGAMVKSIRNVETALGSDIKRPSPSELKNIPVARRSIVAARDIQKGEVFSAENITAKRPGIGLTPMLWDNVVGKRSKMSFRKDDLIRI